ncbi:MAG: helix-turn-helix domain-containing protein [Defluviitaleaceae bacterium]|nr:helix-turn-helix domain-containing protein [Defluviitaleaceae bacterium]
MAYKYQNRYLQLGLNIAYYRKLKGFTQVQLSEIVDISRTHMSNIEAPGMIKSVSLDVLFNIADALGVEPGKLLEIRG